MKSKEIKKQVPKVEIKKQVRSLDNTDPDIDEKPKKKF